MTSTFMSTFHDPLRSTRYLQVRDDGSSQRVNVRKSGRAAGHSAFSSSEGFYDV